MFSFSKDEILKVPRIAILYSDPQWADFIDPIKQAFEIPETLFKNIHINEFEEGFIHNMSQFLICIICPNTYGYSGVDLGNHYSEWLNFLDQGSFLMVFGVDVEWLSHLGERFQIKGKSNPDVHFGRYNFRDTSIAHNGMCLEGGAAIEPLLGEYEDISSVWRIVAESENNKPILVTQIFGNSQITVCSGTLGTDRQNMKKIIPVKILYWGITNSWLGEKSEVFFDESKGVSMSVELESKLISNLYPGRLNVCYDTFLEANTKNASEIVFNYSIFDSKNVIVREKDFTWSLTSNSRCLFKTIEFNVENLPDGTYRIQCSFSSDNIKWSENLEFTVISEEIGEIITILDKSKQFIQETIENLEKDLTEIKSLESINDEVIEKTELLRRLLFLRTRVSVGFNTIDNILRCDKKYNINSPEGHSSLFSEMKHIRFIRDEIIVKIRDIPGWRQRVGEIIPLDSCLNDNQKRLLMIQTLGSNLKVEFVWDAKPDDPIQPALSGSDKRRSRNFFSIWNNGLPLFFATITPQSQKYIQKLTPQLSSPSYIPYKDPILESSNARLYISKSAREYPESASAVCIYGNIEIAMNGFHPDILIMVTTRFFQLQPLTDDDIRKLLENSPMFPHIAEFTSLLLQQENSEKFLLEVETVKGDQIKFSQSETNNGKINVKIGENLPFSKTDFESACNNLKSINQGLLIYYLADLHSHSTASDGMLSVLDCAFQALCAGIDIYGLSDHHTTKPSFWLADYARKDKWVSLIVPGCQEVTHVYLHSVALNAQDTVFELTPVEEMVIEGKKVGAELIFSHARQPHKWPKQQLALGSKSEFIAFDIRPQYLSDYKSCWQKDNCEPIWSNSTDADSSCFSRTSRTVFLKDMAKENHKDGSNIEQIQYPIISIEEVITQIKEDHCVAVANTIYYGSNPNVFLLSLIRHSECKISQRFQAKKLVKYLSLI